MLELTVALPVRVLLMVGVMQFGLLVYDYNMLTNAAVVGARQIPIIAERGIMQNSDSDTARVSAIHSMLNRSNGKPPQSLDIRNKDGVPFTAIVPTIFRLPKAA